MATPMVLKTSFISINGVDRSSWCSKIELSAEVEEKDVTTFANSGWKAVIGGLFSGSLALTFKQDIQDDQLDETLWTLFLAGTTTFATRLTSSATSASNPGYSGVILMKEWKPISGSVGDVAEVDVSFPTSGPISRTTA